MKVKAIEKVYYDHEIKMPGEVFELHEVKTTNAKGEEITVSVEDQFSHRSMESLEDASPAEKKAKPRKHGANKGERQAVTRHNPNTGDNVKSKKDIDLAHGGEQEGEDDEDEEHEDAKGADVL